LAGNADLRIIETANGLSNISSATSRPCSLAGQNPLIFSNLFLFVKIGED
jgi:hypothetical protein